MRRTFHRRLVRLAATGLLLLLPATARIADARPRELELRGTLLCRAEGDPRRERPTDQHGLVIEPVGYPGSAEIPAEAGLFRLRLPYTAVDHELVLKIYSGGEPLDAFTVYIEPEKVRRLGEKYVYSISSHVLPRRCEDLTGNADTALQLRDRLRTQAAPVQAAGFRLPRSWLSGIAAALVGGGAYAATAQSPGDGAPSINAAPTEPYPVPSGLVPVYSQFSSAPMLGRTLTSVGHEDEAAFWNPSLLVFTGENRLAGSGGVRNEWRGSAAWRIPYRSESVPVWLPRVVSAGFIGVAWHKDEEIKTPELDAQMERRHDENLAMLGLGFAASDEVSVSLNIHKYHQKFGTIETVKDGSKRLGVYDNRTGVDKADLDLGLTWEAGDELRLAVAAYSIGGAEGLDAVHHEMPQSRGVAGASWIRDRFQAGAEFGMNSGELNAAAGVSYRIVPALAIDVSASSRWETLQAGLDFTPGPLSGVFRIRWDDRESAAVHLGAGVGW